MDDLMLELRNASAISHAHSRWLEPPLDGPAPRNPLADPEPEEE